MAMAEPVLTRDRIKFVTEHGSSLTALSHLPNPTATQTKKNSTPQATVQPFADGRQSWAPLQNPITPNFDNCHTPHVFRRRALSIRPIRLTCLCQVAFRSYLSLQFESVRPLSSRHHRCSPRMLATSVGFVLQSKSPAELKKVLDQS
jgi:hypothetical protein